MYVQYIIIQVQYVQCTCIHAASTPLEYCDSLTDMHHITYMYTCIHEKESIVNKAMYSRHLARNNNKINM